MLFVYVFLFLLMIGATITFRLSREKKILAIVSLTLFGVFLIGEIIVGLLYGRKLFALDDPHLGGWIFIVGALLMGSSCGFALTYVKLPIVSKILLGISFVLAGILLTMCIYEAKVCFANGINSNSPGNTSTESSSEEALLALLLHC